MVLLELLNTLQELNMTLILTPIKQYVEKRDEGYLIARTCISLNSISTLV